MVQALIEMVIGWIRELAVSIAGRQVEELFMSILKDRRRKRERRHKRKPPQ